VPDRLAQGAANLLPAAVGEDQPAIWQKARLGGAGPGPRPLAGARKARYPRWAADQVGGGSLAHHVGRARGRETAQQRTPRVRLLRRVPAISPVPDAGLALGGRERLLVAVAEDHVGIDPHRELGRGADRQEAGLYLDRQEDER